MNAYLQTVSSHVNQSNLSHCFVLKVKKKYFKMLRAHETNF